MTSFSLTVSPTRLSVLSAVFRPSNAARPSELEAPHQPVIPSAVCAARALTFASCGPSSSLLSFLAVLCALCVPISVNSVLPSLFLSSSPTLLSLCSSANSAPLRYLFLFQLSTFISQPGSHDPMTLFPAFLKLENRQVIIIGGGSLAESKLPALLEAGARVRIISPRLNPQSHGPSPAPSISTGGPNSTNQAISPAPSSLSPPLPSPKSTPPSSKRPKPATSSATPSTTSPTATSTTAPSSSAAISKSPSPRTAKAPPSLSASARNSQNNSAPNTPPGSIGSVPPAKSSAPKIPIPN